MSPRGAGRSVQRHDGAVCDDETVDGERQPDWAEWLETHGLSAYASLFEQHAVTDPDVVAEMSEDDLREIGLPVGARKLVRRAVEGTGRWRGGIRRHLTVLFCDLVGSTRLSTQLDPEDLADFTDEYSRRCATVAEEHGGHVVNFLGDGVLVVFGYPRASEGSAERAVLAGLVMVDEVAALEDDPRFRGIAAAARVGIATGEVIIGATLRRGSAVVQQATGEAMNVAARVQSVAPPGGVVVAEGTLQQLGRRFEVEDWGTHEMRGLPEPVRVHRVVRARRAESRFAERLVKGTTPLVGRERELALLLELWNTAVDHGAVTVVIAAPGMGKSRLVDELRQRVSGDAKLLQCSPLHGATVLHPLVDLLGRDLRLPADTDPRTVYDALASVAHLLGPDPHAVALLGLLMTADADDRHPLPAMSAAERRARTTAAGVSYLAAGDARRLVIVEDLHWADATTRELVGTLAQVTGDHPLVLVMTLRPEGEPPPVAEGALTLTLGPLPGSDAAELVAQLSEGTAVPDAVVATITERGDGVPLFLEELWRAVAGQAEAGGNGSITVPASLHDSLLGRLDELARSRPLAEVASVLGTAVDLPVLVAVSGLSDEDAHVGLEELLASGVLVADRSEGRMRWSHALLRDAAYGEMRRGRRHSLHGNVADALLTQFPDLSRAQPELVARHLAAAGRRGEAVPFLLAAGTLAAERSATVEALLNLDAGIEALADVPAGPDRDRFELQLELRRCGMLRVSKGFGHADVLTSALRTRGLATLLGDDDALVTALNAEYSYHLQHSYQRAGAVAAELLALAEHRGDDKTRMMGSRAVGIVEFHRGRIASAVQHIRTGLSIYDRERHAADAYVYGTDHAETMSAFLGLAQFCAGDISDAERCERWALEHAEQIQHLPSISQALTYLGFLGLLARRPALVAESGPRLVELGERIRFPVMVHSGRFWLAAIHLPEAAPGPELDAAIGAAIQADQDWQSTQNHSYRPFRMAVLAEGLVRAGRLDEAEALLREADVLGVQTDERWADAERLRVRAALLEARGDLQGSEDTLRNGIALATSQAAAGLVLRSTVALTALRQRTGRLEMGDVERLRGAFRAVTGPPDAYDVVAAQVVLAASS